MSDSPMPWALRFLSGPVSRIYAQIITARNTQFDLGNSVVEIDRPVISVGNLSVGGTGKTPMVRTIIRELLQAGHRPVIAMRGYAGSKGESDEATEYRAEFPDVPVVAQADRLQGLLDLFHTPEGEHRDCVVLDDGFQHRRIARQSNIVLLDATRDPFTDQMLPKGWLREPVESLKRATFIVLTHAEAVTPSVVEKMRRETSKVAPGVAIAVCRHSWAGLRVMERGGDREEPVHWLQNKRVLAACGIGNPKPFLRAVGQATGSPPTEFVRPDHDPFDNRTIGKMFELATRHSVGVIVVTGKDWAKLRKVRPEAWPCPVVRPRLEMSFDSGLNELRQQIVALGSKEVGSSEE